MLKITESLRAMQLAQSLVHRGAAPDGREAREYLALCMRADGSNHPSAAAFIQRQKEKTTPVIAIILLAIVVILALGTGRMQFFLFAPAFLFAAILARLHRQALDRLAVPANEEKA